MGKSTLFKHLTGVSVPAGRRPGVTLKPYSVQFGDLTITDMPGFGFMSGIKERKQDIVKTKLIRYIERHRDRIVLAILVVNGSSFSEIVDRWQQRGEIPIEVEMYDFLHELDLNVVVAVNKIDRIRDLDSVMDGVAERLGMLPPWRQWPDFLVPVSAAKGDIKHLSGLIRGILHNPGRDDAAGFIN